MTAESLQVVEVIGEGKTDRGAASGGLSEATDGVVTVLLRRLCDNPTSLRVRKRPYQFLIGKTLWQKVKFSKLQAIQNHAQGIVFVMDTEGDHPRILIDLQRGGDALDSGFPMAVGVAHPCTEAWLLSDPGAIRRALGLTNDPVVPERPESLPPPCKDRTRSPKAVLARCAGVARKAIASAQSTRIAEKVDLDLLPNGVR